jgi:hypothetical protein
MESKSEKVSTRMTAEEYQRLKMYQDLRGLSTLSKALRAGFLEAADAAGIVVVPKPETPIELRQRLNEAIDAGASEEEMKELYNRYQASLDKQKGAK